jgi:hypothetical protein
MFRLAYETGSKLQVINKQNLTPLTLAAKLGKKKVGGWEKKEFRLWFAINSRFHRIGGIRGVLNFFARFIRF